MNEFELIGRYFRRPVHDPAVIVGSGDDAAVVRPAPGCELAMSVDMLVEGRHFLPGTDAEALGHKTLAVNLSDLAAMGATPRWALLAGALPAVDEPWLAAFSRGFLALAARFDVALVGGDTTRGPLNLCVTILGELPAGTALTRQGAQVGDDVYVSGTLGDAALALAALQSRTALDADGLAGLRGRLERPEPRVALGLALRGVASAVIDLSDGLTGDLRHVLDASHAGAELRLDALPVGAALASRLAGPERALALQCALAGGDDYELCFTAPVAQRHAIAAIAQTMALPLTRIGTITSGAGLVIRDEGGNTLPSLPDAWDHFA
jgi:thiamine-monophosphate kinase